MSPQAKRRNLLKIHENQYRHPATSFGAEVAELVDASDSKSEVLYGCGGSSPPLGTILIKGPTLQGKAVAPLMIPSQTD